MRSTAARCSSGVSFQQCGETHMAIPASVSDVLDRHHARYSVLRHPVAYTAQEEAAAAQVPRA